MISKAARVWYFCLFSLIFLFSAHSYASWQKIAQFGRQAHCAFFFSELNGFIGVTGDIGIFQTTDGGKTWKKMITPSSIFGDFTSIFFSDPLNGWASVELDPDPAMSRVIKTTDGGATWFFPPNPPRGQGGTCVYQTSKAIILTTRGKATNSSVSSDNGNSWYPAIDDSLNGIDFVDDLHGVATGYEGAKAFRTTDGGLTWIPIPLMREESWGVYGVKGTATFLIAPEGNNDDGQTPIYRSIDYGASWQVISTPLLPFRSTGHIHGFGGNIIYVQVEDFTSYPNKGMWRSDDGGFNWHSVSAGTPPPGQPNHERDRRFFVTGCSGGVVYAFDNNGGVWKTRDGGDGTIFEPNPEPVFMGLPITFSSRICATTFAQIRIANQYCDTLRILDATFLDPNDDAVRSGAIAITNAAKFPVGIEGGGMDSIEFRWDPSRYIHTDTTVSIQVRIRYFSKALFTVRDTVITISAQAIGDEPSVALTPTFLDFDTINFCVPKDSAFSLRNEGCDTLFILSASGAAPANYQLFDNAGNPIVYPVRIAPGGNFSYTVRLFLSNAGLYTSTITLRVRHQGKIKDTTVSLRAILSSRGTYTATTILDFGKVSICAPKDSFVVIKNLACDTLLVNSASLQSGGEFSIVGNPVPMSIFPDSLKNIALRYSPTDLGVDSDTLLLSLVTLGDIVPVKIIIRGEGIAGDAMLVMVPAADTLFDLRMTRCDTLKRYSIVLSNPGCKNLNIIDAKLEGPPTRNIALTSVSSLPTGLRLGSATTVWVDVAPIDVERTSGLIRIRYQIDGEAERDTVLYYALQVDYGKRTLALDAEQIDFGSYRLCIEKDTTIVLRNTGCDTLDLTSTIFTGGMDETMSNPRTLRLGPGDTTSVHYHISPVSAGQRTATIEIASLTDSTNPLLVRLNSFIVPTDTILLNIAPVRFPFYVGDTITIQVIPEKPVDASFGLRDIAFTLYYNGDLLTLIPTETRTFPVGTTYLTGNTTTFYPQKQIAQRFFMNGSPYIAFNGNEPIMEFRFYISLTDTTNTALEIGQIELNGNSSTFSKCVLGFTSALSDLELALRCGDSLLREFMRKGNQFTLSSTPVFPDPLTEQNGFEASVSVEIKEAGTLSLYIYDAVGKTVRAISTEGSKGVNRLKIDGSELPAGAYSYILFDGREYGRGRFVIAR